jgi:capsular exopolysaccharide synthesis family protein
VKWLEEGSGVIGLSITGANPKKEVDFLTGLIRIYQQADLERKRETADRTIEFIDSQLRVIQDSLKRVEQSLADFGLKASRQNISLEAQRLLDQLSTIASEQTILTVRDRYFSYLHEQFSNSETSDNIILPASVGIVDPVFNSLIQRWVEIQSQARMHKVNPLVQLKKDEAVLIKAKVIESVQALVDADRIKSTLLTQQTRETERLLNLLPATERKLVGVQRNYTLLENLYVFLMQKSSEAGISKAATTSDIQVVNPPMQGGAIAPKPRQNYTIAIFAGLLIPFLFFVFVELIDNKVQSKEDIERLTTIPFVGGIGHNQMESNLIVSQKPKSGVAESFRALRSNLNYFTGGQAKKVFMVSSSISGEGKTFTTINLATVFALSGKRTLIVGADMRRPKIFQDFNCDNTAGLTTFLSGLTSFENIVQPTEIANLSLVSGGPVPPNPSELLLTDRFQQFITEALNQFDFVLIDTPPLALVTDAFVISKYVDHTVFVVRQNYTPKEFIKSIDEYYRSEKIKNISILLNDIYKSGLGYGYGASYAYQYGYSYGYGYGRKKKNGEGYYDET